MATATQERTLARAVDPRIDQETGEIRRDLAVIEGEVRIVSIDQTRSIAEKLRERQLLQDYVRQIMVPGLDYGRIPGAGDKDVLFKPGAEKLLREHHIVVADPRIEAIEDWERGFWTYRVTLPLRYLDTGEIVGYGVGSANSRESQYRWRSETSWHDSPPCQCHREDEPIEQRKQACGAHGWAAKWVKPRNQPQGKWVWERKVENEERWNLPNTLLKMAKKRAVVDGCLSVTMSSDLFTQDLEDYHPADAAGAPPAGPPVQAPRQQQSGGQAQAGRPARPSGQPPESPAPRDYEAEAKRTRDPRAIAFLALAERIRGVEGGDKEAKDAAYEKLKAITTEFTADSLDLGAELSGPRKNHLARLVKTRLGELGIKVEKKATPTSADAERDLSPAARRQDRDNEQPASPAVREDIERRLDDSALRQAEQLEDEDAW